jgi:hypothetical protein
MKREAKKSNTIGNSRRSLFQLFAIACLWQIEKYSPLKVFEEWKQMENKWKTLNGRDEAEIGHCVKFKFF